jgi:hypothetical protein
MYARAARPIPGRGAADLKHPPARTGLAAVEETMMADAADLIAPDEPQTLPTSIDLREYNKSGVAEVLASSTRS